MVHIEWNVCAEHAAAVPYLLVTRHVSLAVSPLLMSFPSHLV